MSVGYSDRVSQSESERARVSKKEEEIAWLTNRLKCCLHEMSTPQFIQPCELLAHFPVWKCFWQRKSSKSGGTSNPFADEICMIIVFIVRAPLKCFMQSSDIFGWVFKVCFDLREVCSEGYICIHICPNACVCVYPLQLRVGPRASVKPLCDPIDRAVCPPLPLPPSPLHGTTDPCL